MANSCGNGSCCDSRHCTWPQARGSLTNGHKSLTFFIRLEADWRWKGARFSPPTMALCQHGHTPPILTPRLAMESTEFEGEREESHVLGLQNDYPVFRTVFLFFIFTLKFRNFSHPNRLWYPGSLNMVLNTEHHLSRNNDANCHLLSIYCMPGSSAGAL